MQANKLSAASIFYLYYSTNFLSFAFQIIWPFEL